MRTSFAPRGGVEYREENGRQVQVYPPTKPTAQAATGHDDEPELSVRVAIGRNVGDDPLPDSLWTNFQNAIWGTLLAHVVSGDPRVEIHHGSGTFEGVTEESAVLSLIGATAFDEDGFLFAVRRIAKVFGQKAVAVTFGWTTLVTTD